MKTNKRFLKLSTICVFVFVLLLTLTSCGNNKTYKTYEDSASAILNAQQTTLVTELNKNLATVMTSDEEKAALIDRINYAAQKLADPDTNKNLNNQIETVIAGTKEEGVKFNEEKVALLNKFAEIKTDSSLVSETVAKNLKDKIRSYVAVEGVSKSLQDAVLAELEEIFTNALLDVTLGANTELLSKVYGDVESYTNTYVAVIEKTRTAVIDTTKIKAIVISVTKEAIVSEMKNYKDNHLEGAEDFRVALADKSFEELEKQLENVTELDYSNVKDENVENTNNGYQILKNFTLDVANYTSTKYQEPIRWKPITSFGGFFSNFFNNFLVFPIGWLMKTLSVLFGGYYVIGLLLATVLVRTIAWPIYAKTNDMTIKMQLMQPELTKLQEKYANRPDPESQNQMRMEQARLYKKYKVGIGGCLLQFLQFPIFIAVFNAVNRMPYTTGEVPGTNNWLSQLNTHVASIDLLKDHGELWSNDFWAIILIIILVLLTQQINQKVNEVRQKAAQDKAQENIPAYRRQAAAQSANNSSMKYMMAFLSVMMVVFVWQSAAGLGIYWLIGNIYSTVQTIINNKLSEKRAEKLRSKYESYKY